MASLRPCTRRLLPLIVASGRGCSLPLSSSHSYGRLIPISCSTVTSYVRCRSTNEGTSSGPSERAKANGRRLQVMTGAMTAFLGGLYLLYRQLSAKEGDDSAEQEAGQESKNEEEGDEKEEVKESKRISFHDRRVIEYENRIRAYSTPDKIFRYFATINIKDLETGSSNIYMTPSDFLRSITPGEIQPADLGLDKFRNMTLESWKKQHKAAIRPNSVFSSLGYYGLISFSDYLFLLTSLATPARNFEIAFMMFDLNGDGEVDYEEFQTVQEVILGSTAVGARHRDHSTTGSVAGSVGEALVEHFFGTKKDQKLTADKFKVFHSQLIEELMKLEFDRYAPVNGRISEVNFARHLLSYSSMNDQRRKKYVKRIKKAYGSELPDCPNQEGGVSFEEAKMISKLVEATADVEMALSMYSAAGASITAGDLKSVANAVSGVELNDRLVELLITLFDEDGDGNLSHREFVKVLKSRTTRGLEKSKELGFSRFVGAVVACSIKTAKDQIGLKS